ncbi:malectin domain-containing carbohydrate-binding protein [Cytophagaceae bacterium DM2B3-1]|uniref:Malectin domain-containing carbohydrate-binding protein n=1 Tax=Xanthocytophaga flava TaxID=3048013 RepID=A0ABT7CWF9_9BACT|nr:malectin domain-containing carbohydrate-binding protein [Xanthocytophaga flavus]MDJ1498092.1 malectin domain-containing carbohydrate-binding protein [Xanthocytophaga flavus]
MKNITTTFLIVPRSGIVWLSSFIIACAVVFLGVGQIPSLNSVFTRNLSSPMQSGEIFFSSISRNKASQYNTTKLSNGYIDTSGIHCTSISPLSCEQIIVKVDSGFILNFNGNEGGLADKNGIGTGFRMADPPSARLVADKPVTDPTIPGYEPSRLEIADGLLKLTTNRGISYLKPSGTGTTSPRTNSQINALGVGFNATRQKVTIETIIVNPFVGTEGQQAGIWYGLDEDNYAKLVVHNGTLELRREIGAASGETTIDVIKSGSTPIAGIGTSILKLKMVIDHASNTLTGFYSMNNGTEKPLGAVGARELSIPTLIEGKTVNSQPNISFAGVLATHRNAGNETSTTPLANPPIYSFDRFSIEAQANTLTFASDSVNFTLERQDSVSTKNILLTASSGIPSVTLQSSTDSSWLRLPAPAIGNLPFTVATTGLNPGPHSAIVTAYAPGYYSDSIYVSVTVWERPYVISSTPEDGATNVDISNLTISANNLYIPEGKDLNKATVNTTTVKLIRLDANGNEVEEIAGGVNDTGGGDAISFTPNAFLLPNTTYKFMLTAGVKLLSGEAFLPYTAIFKTGSKEVTPPIDLTGVAFNKDINFGPNLTGRHSSLVIGPDHKLYASTLEGTIKRWVIQADGTLSSYEELTPVLTSSRTDGTNGQVEGRTIIGLAFDPAATANNLIVYITHCKTADFDQTSEDPLSWDGKVTQLSGPSLSVVKDVVIGLPRSRKDHLTNSLAFKHGEPHAIYISQGSNSAGGESDNYWRKKENLLSGAVLKLDLDKLPESAWPLVVRTTDNINVINAAPENIATMSDGTYNPYASTSPLTIFGSGIRNGYDLIWHSNGQLYVPANGTAGGSNSPGSANYLKLTSDNRIRRPDGTFYNHTDFPVVPSITGNNAVQKDWLFRVEKGGYYGHPNPYRGEFVLNHGGIQYQGIPGQTQPYTDVPKYPATLGPDPNYRSAAYDFGLNKSPNGVIEFRSAIFNKRLQGLLMVARFSNGNDIILLHPDSETKEIVNAYLNVPGMGGFDDPLDLTEDTLSGNIYVSEFDRDGNGVPRIVLLRPAPGKPVLVANTSRLVTDDVIDQQETVQKITLSNTGTANLIIDSLVTRRHVFSLSTLSFPIELETDESFELPVRFNASTTGPVMDTLTIYSNDKDSSFRHIVLGGLGKKGVYGDNEPSLQWILTTHGLPVNVGDDNPSTRIIHSQSSQYKASLLGDEISAPLFRQAVDAPVTVQVLGVYGPSGQDTTVVFGWYLNGSPDSKNELFAINGSSGSNQQTLQPTLTGGTQFNISDDRFGFYSRWPSLQNRTIYSEDGLNTFQGAIPHHIRVYPVPNEANAYIIAIEEDNSGFGFQGLVVLVRNIMPVPVGHMVSNVTELVFDGLINTTIGPKSITITNQSEISVQITGISFSGANANAFKFASQPVLPSVIPAGGSVSYQINFAPGEVFGSLSAALQINTTHQTTSRINIGLYGLSNKGEQGTYEPPLYRVVTTLGYSVNVGGTGLSLGTSATLIGEEVATPLFQKAGSANVTLVPVARYSPDGILPFGYYTRSGETIRTNPVASIDVGYEQNLYPPVVSGGTTNFNPGLDVFGIYIDSQSASRVTYTEDNLNTVPNRVVHAVRVYPAKNRQGQPIPNAYLICFEEATNGDYQDYVFLLSNVVPAGKLKQLVVTPHILTDTVAAGAFLDKSVQITALNGVPDTIMLKKVTAASTWLTIPETGSLQTPTTLQIKAASLQAGSYQEKVIASATGFAPDTLLVNITVVTPPTLHIDFQPPAGIVFNGVTSSGATHPGYLAELGEAYDAGRGYGWIDPVTKAPKANQEYSRERSGSDELRLRTFINMRHSDAGPTQYTDWEYTLPNGQYLVTVAVGDATSISGNYYINAEGIPLISNFIPTSANKYKIATGTVKITDGKLTIDANGGSANNNTRICYLHISPFDPNYNIVAPVVNLQLTGTQITTGTYRQQAQLTVAASDRSGVGLASVSYSLDNGPFVPYVSSVPISGQGNHSVQAKAVDNKGIETQSPLKTFSIVSSPISNAKILVENRDKFPADDQLTFSLLRTPYKRPNTPSYNADHDSIRVRIYNKGFGTLRIDNLILSRPNSYRIRELNNSAYNPATSLPVQVNPGAYVDAIVSFVNDPSLQVSRVLVLHDTLTIVSNDDTSPAKKLLLHSLLQKEGEGTSEPTVNEIIFASGLKSRTGYTLYDNSQGESFRISNADEIAPMYLTRADMSQPVYIRQLGAYHSCCISTETVQWFAKGSTSYTTVFTHIGLDAQSLLPRKDRPNTPAEGTFTPSGAFGLKVYNVYSDTSRNSGRKIGLRFFKAIDQNGNLIPNAYVMAMDYIGQPNVTNYDYQDNVYFISNVRPEKGSAGYSVLATTAGSDLDFGMRHVGILTTVQLTLKNLGITSPADPAIVITSIELTGQNASEFGVSMPVDATLSPQEATLLNVKFAPNSEGLKNAVILVHYNNSSTPLRIPIYGIGQGSSNSVVAIKRIKAGSASALTINGGSWEADVTYRKGPVKEEKPLPAPTIAATDEDELYQTSLSASSNTEEVRYEIPIGPGRYFVRLHFAENTFTTAGSRVFSIRMENQLLLANLDIFQEAGNRTALVKDFVVTTDAILNINFKASVNFFTLAGIEIYQQTPSSPTFNIIATKITPSDPGAANGSISVTTNATVPMLYKLGSTGTYDTVHVFKNLSSNTYTIYAKENQPGGCEASQTFAVSEKSSNISYNVSSTLVSCNAVADGTATVKTPTGGQAPYTYRWSTNPVQTGATATNLAAGSYTVTLTDSNGKTQSQSVVISKQNNCFAAGSQSQNRISLYPNPTTGLLTVQLLNGIEATKVETTTIVNQIGIVQVQNEHKVIGTHTMEIDLTQLRAGIYLLRVKAGEFTQTIGFIKQ